MVLVLITMASLDSLNLTPYEFRIFFHLCWQTTCTDSVTEIGRRLRLSPHKVSAAIGRLIGMGLVDYDYAGDGSLAVPLPSDWPAASFRPGAGRKPWERLRNAELAAAGSEPVQDSLRELFEVLAWL